MAYYIGFYPVVEQVEGSYEWNCSEQLFLGKDWEIEAQLERLKLNPVTHRWEYSRNFRVGVLSLPGGVEARIDGELRWLDTYDEPLHHARAGDLQKIDWSGSVSPDAEKVRKALAALPPESRVIIYWS